ncbi:MAG TPA: DUF6049 family protein [Sporichthyaceae bacterium]|nr:DUF6049 family protein [Sporichthyaceae bacterium]
MSHAATSGRRRYRLFCLGAALTLIVASPLAAAPVGAAPAPTGAQVLLDDMTPSAPQANSKLVLRGELRNTGAGTIRQASVSLLLRRRLLIDRGEVKTLAEATDLPAGSEPIAGTGGPLGRDVAPGASVPWTITVPISALHLGADGVYAISVQAAGQRDNTTPGVRRVGSLTTFLPYLSKPKSFRPVTISWLWPLAGTPARDGTGAFLQRAAGGEFAPTGRLAQLVATVGKYPVTWLLDPELLDSTAELSVAHQRVNGSGTTDEAADPGAAKWLSDVRTELAGKPVAALPYGDPDLAGLVHNGYPGAIASAEAQSRLVTGRTLDRQSDTSVAFPPTGLADKATLAALRTGGTQTVVLSGAQFPALATLNHTPTGRVGVDTEAGHLEVLIADTGLTDDLSGDLSAAGTGAPAAQRLLADTAMITLERPNEQRSILINPPRRWNPSPDSAGRLLNAVNGAPWLRLAELKSLSVLPVPSELANANPAYPPVPGPHELKPGYVNRLHGTATDLDRLSAVLVKPGPMIESLTDATLVAAASTWTTDPKGANTYLRNLADQVQDDTGKVKVVGRSIVTLSSSNGNIPLTIYNELDAPVRVRAEVQPLVAGRLRTQASDLVTIAAGRKVPVRIPAKATVNGITRVEVDLVDAAGDRFGSPMPLRVNVTNYGSVGLIIVIGGGGLLFTAAVIRNIRRIRKARAAPASSGRAARTVDAVQA